MNKVKIKVGYTLPAQQIVDSPKCVQSFTALDDSGNKRTFSEKMNEWGRNREEIAIVPIPDFMLKHGSGGYDVMCSDGKDIGFFPLEWLFGVREIEVEETDLRYVKLLSITTGADKGLVEFTEMLDRLFSMFGDEE